MKKWIVLLVGIVMILAGLYGPFYLGSEVFPEGWVTYPYRYWWSFPTLVMLLWCGGGAVVLGIITATHGAARWAGKPTHRKEDKP